MRAAFFLRLLFHQRAKCGETSLRVVPEREFGAERREGAGLEFKGRSTVPVETAMNEVVLVGPSLPNGRVPVDGSRRIVECS